ncbi:MAG: AraC family transcriptional regulator [Oscillospiraceae bacterium]|nr:AraC family transcriptional regulator [Oscillospiraceae bacterium]
MSTIPKQIVYTQFLQRENYTRHHRYDEEMLQYEYIKNGDARGNEAAEKMFASEATGKLSDDPLRNIKYLFVCSMTLVTRFVIEGGMEAETAYNASDLYIQNADKCKTIDEVQTLHKNMIAFFINHMNKMSKENVFSKPIITCHDYIYEHLHSTITIDELANHVGLNSSYLSTLFKKEVGISASEYIRRKRIEAGENMLKYSNFSLSEISEYLAFSSYSHFAGIFRKYTHFSPKEYRKKFYRTTNIVTK